MVLHALHRVWCYVAAFFILSFVIMIHEAGHWVAAEMCGAHCATYNLGFGPGVKIGQVSETEIWIRSIPFGGFVEMPMSEPFGNSGVAISDLSTFQKLFVFAAGIAVNFVSGVAMLIYLEKLNKKVSVPGLFYEMAVKKALRSARNASKFKINWAARLGVKVHKTLSWLLNFFAASANPFISLSEGPMIGWRGIVKEIGLLSFGVAVFNVLPIAPLDGSRIFDAVFLGGVLSGGSPVESITTTEVVAILTGAAFLIIPVILGLLPSIILTYRFEGHFYHHLFNLKGTILKKVNTMNDHELHLFLTNTKTPKAEEEVRAHS